ncbi:TPA: hypothetical protein LSX51_001658, partial [Escherichia coli]|nr:hypothetical protein [Escherichia coli]
MDINYVVSKMEFVDDLINAGSFDSAYKNVKDILNGIDEINTIKENRI